jgi:hypothetical protein
VRELDKDGNVVEDNRVAVYNNVQIGEQTQQASYTAHYATNEAGLTTITNEFRQSETVIVQGKKHWVDNNNDTSNNSSKKSSVNSSLISQQFRTQFGSVAETDNLIEATSSKHITTYSNLLSKIKRSLPQQQQPPHIYTKVSSLNILKIYQQQVQQNRTVLKPKQRISQYSESQPYSSRQTIPNTTDRNETNSISFTHFNAYSEVNDESGFDDAQEEQVNKVKSQRYRIKDVNDECAENANGNELMQGDKQCLRQMKIKKVDFTVKKRKVKGNRKSRNYIQFPKEEKQKAVYTHDVIKESNNDNDNNNYNVEDSFYKDDKSVERYGVNYCNTCNSFSGVNDNSSCVVF